MQFLGAVNDFSVPLTPTSIPPGISSGVDNLAPTNGTFGNGVGAAGPYDLMSGGATITAVSDLMFGSSSIDLMGP